MITDPLGNPWFHWAFIAGGILILALGVEELVRHGRRRRNWVPGHGHIVSTRLDDGQIRVQVAFQQDGREVRFWNRSTSTRNEVVGRPVAILVNPVDPADAVVAGGVIGGGVVGGVFLLAGLLFTGVGAAMAGWL